MGLGDEVEGVDRSGMGARRAAANWNTGTLATSAAQSEPLTPAPPCAGWLIKDNITARAVPLLLQYRLNTETCMPSTKARKTL